MSYNNYDSYDGMLLNTPKKKRTKLEDPDGMISYMDDIFASVEPIENKPNIYDQPGVEYDLLDDLNIKFGGKSKFEIEAMKRNELDLSSDFNTISKAPYNSNYNANNEVRKAIAPRQYLEFDGENLYMKEEGQVEDAILYQWPAMSGRPDKQSKEYTNLKNEGPIPEGNWEVPLSKLQSYRDTQTTIFHDIFNLNPFFGKYKGGIPAWGYKRAWIYPGSGTDTQGRDGLTIHGGTSFGSAGCIDLADNYDEIEFAEAFKKYGDNLQLRVKYKEGF